MDKALADNNVEDIKKYKEELEKNEELQQITTEMYANAQQAAQADATQEQPTSEKTSKDDDVIDADFEEVDKK